MSKQNFALVDCNNFYVSCERLFKPALQNKPVIVLSNNDGCVISRSQEAKDIGIPMGAPAFKFEKMFRQHGVVTFSSNYALYGDMSRRVMEVLSSVVAEVEVYSIDEAFVSMTGIRDALSTGEKMRSKVKKHTGIPVSIGIAPTKVLAKVANHIAKKNKQYNSVMEISDNDIDNYLYDFPVSELWGIGRQYVKLLNYHNIHTAFQLKNLDDGWIKKYLTIQGLRMAYELRGISCIPLEEEVQPQKNVASTRSFGRRVTELSELKEAVAMYATRAAEKLRRQKLAAKHIYVFINTNRFSDDEQYGNGAKAKLTVATNYTPSLIHTAHTLLEQIYRPGIKYWKAGVICLDLVPEDHAQPDLFGSHDKVKVKQVMTAMDTINKKFGRQKVRSAAVGIGQDWNMKRRMLSQKFTTSWQELPIAKA